jgi:taurine dioxygenase
MTLTITPSAGALGAEVGGLSLANIDDERFAEVERLLVEHMVLFFPEQNLTPDQHRALASRFGEMEIHPFIPKFDVDHPEIVVLKSSEGGIADVWHTDVTFSASPPLCSVLHMELLPEHGGDTMWSNQYLAYESLSAPIRELLSGLTAIHTAAVFGHPEVKAEHPVVRIHPVTRRPCLYVNRQFTSHITQLSRGESRALLDYLWSFCEQPQFTCRQRWHEGDIGIWDNRATQHYVVNDYIGERIIHRVTILGDDPQAAFDTTLWPTYAPAKISAAALDRF